VIVVLSYDYPPNDGGISRLVAELVTGLHRRGEDLRVLTLHNGSHYGPVRPDVPTSEIAPRSWHRDLGALRFILRQPRQVRLLASIWNPEATLAWLAGRSQQLWVLAHGNEVMPYPPGLRHAWKRWLRRRVLASAQLVICNSRYTERMVKAASPQARTLAIPLGVDAARFQSGVEDAVARSSFDLPQDRRVLLSVSRLNAYKGHDTVLRAIAALPGEARDKLHYAIAGKGEHMDALQALAAELGIVEQVQWLGYVAEDALPRLYACADLFVLCTREDPRERGVEGFGLAFLEAQAAGVPVLGTRAGGIPDAVAEGRGGWLVAQNDVVAVSARLAALAAGDPAFAEQGRLGRQRMLQECEWGVYVDKVCDAMGLRSRSAPAEGNGEG
jgi:phosphatidylinositol alpha-1,6-mannosyltransferase